MGKKKKPPDPYRWSVFRLNAAAECSERLRRQLTEEQPPKIPLFAAGIGLHGAARFAVWNRNFQRTDERRCFFKTVESFLSWWSWIYWPGFVQREEEKPGIRWKDRERQYVSFGNYCGELLTGWRLVGPEAPRQLVQVRKRAYYQMMTDPALTFRLLAAERPFNVQFGRFRLTGRMDQIWEILPYKPKKGQPEFLKDGGIVIVDLTMGGGPVKYLQLVLYLLAARLGARQDPKLRKALFWDPKTKRLRYSVAEIQELLDKAVAAVLSLSEAKLKIRRPTSEDFEELQEKLEEGASLVRRIGRKEKIKANPTDSHCRMCDFNFDCRYAATREVIDLETGGYEVFASPGREPEPGVEKYFKGWKQGKDVTQDVVRQPLVQMPLLFLGE